MKSLACCSAAAIVAIWLGGPAMAQSSSSAPEKGNQPSASQTNGASESSLKLTDDQRASIVEAVSSEDTHQRTPANFEPRVGASITSAIKPHPLPRPLVNQLPELKEYYYARLDNNVLVIDPMSKKIVDVIPHRSTTAGKPLTPADWAASRGRQLQGNEPQTSGGGQADQEKTTPGSAAPAH